MPYLTSTFTEINGAIVDLWVGVSETRKAALQRVGFQVPPRVLVKTHVDIEAGITSIAPEVFKNLDLRSIGQTNILTPSTGHVPHPCNKFDVSLAIAHDEGELLVPHITVVETVFGPEEAMLALLGRDVLRHCLLVYDGRHRRFSLAF